MRLLTRSDFDGLACAVLLVEKGIVDHYTFVHPKDIQDGKIEVNKNDVLANIPYVKGCGLWFDHHVSENTRLNLEDTSIKGASVLAPSAAQVIWDYYGGTESFDKKLIPLLNAVNQTDSGRLTQEEILDPKGWILLSFMMDSRTGLGRFSDYRISNYELMEDMIQYCRTKTAEEILELPDIKERVVRYFDQQECFVEMLKRCSTVDKNVVVTHLKDEEVIYAGNRFIIYALFPNQNIEVRVMWGREKKNVVFACGHSILNRTCQTNVGQLMLEYNGGGHSRVGTCQVPIERWEDDLKAIVKRMKENG